MCPLLLADHITNSANYQVKSMIINSISDCLFACLLHLHLHQTVPCH